MKTVSKFLGLIAVAWTAAQTVSLAQNPEKLPTIPGNYTYPSAMNRSGEIVGVTYTTGWKQVTAVRWVNGTVETLPGFKSSIANAISDDGVIVGAEFDGEDLLPQPVTWVTGEPSRLPTLGFGGIAYDINASGDIVGWVNTDQKTVPAVWRNGQLSTLPTLWDNGGEARSIDNQGIITGVSRSEDSASQDPTQWTNGVPAGLPVNYDENYGGVNGISKSGAGTAAGFLVQREYLDDGSLYYINLAVVWKDGQYQVLQRPSGRGNSFAYGVNNLGVAFGYTTSEEGYQTPTLWDQDGAVRLPLDPGRSATAVAANDQGLVVGLDHTDPYNPQPIIWRTNQMNRLQMTGIQTNAGKTITLTATVRRSNQPSSGRRVEFRVNYKNVGFVTTDSKGIASLTYKVPANSSRRTDIMASIGGSNYLIRNLVCGRAATSAAVAPVRVRPGRSTKLSASLRSLETNRPIGNAEVRLMVGGKLVAKGKTSSTGVVKFDYTAPRSSGSSQQKVEVTFVGDADNLPAKAQASMLVKN